MSDASLGGARVDSCRSMGLTDLPGVQLLALAATAGAVGLGIMFTRRRSKKDCDEAAFRHKTTEAPWKASSKKGTNSYYYGHHTRPSDGLDASDYTMNAPRRLDPDTKRPLDEASLAAKEHAVNASRSPMTKAPAASKKEIKRISQYFPRSRRPSFRVVSPQSVARDARGPAPPPATQVQLVTDRRTD